MRSKRLKRDCILFCVGLAFFAMVFCYFELKQRVHVAASFVNDEAGIGVSQGDLSKLVNVTGQSVFVTILDDYSDLGSLQRCAETTPIKSGSFCLVAASGNERSGILYWDGENWSGKEIYKPITSSVLNDFAMNVTDKSGYSFVALLTVSIAEILCFVLAWAEEVYGDFMIKKHKHERSVLRSEHSV